MQPRRRHSLLVQNTSWKRSSRHLGSLCRTLTTDSSSGLEVFALDGYPEAIYDPSPLIEKVKRLRSLLVDEQWTGLQLDIEPYLLDRFSDPHDYDALLASD